MLAVPVLNPLRLRALRDGLVLGGLVYLVWRFAVLGPQDGHVGFDAIAYWVLDPNHPYSLANGRIGSFLYSPPIARLFAPFAILSWPQFWLLWTGLQVGTVIWLGWRRALLVLAFPPVALELYFGNVNLLIAAAIVLGFRYPGAWVFILLTKFTLGVGLLWFAVRREWRSLAIALGATALIVATSVVLDGPLWGEWLARLAEDAPAPLGRPFTIPLWLRLPIAALIVMWGARTDRRWTVPLGATLALPVLWIAAFSILVAVGALDRPALSQREADRPPQGHS